MFGVVMALIFLGYPVAFTLGAPLIFGVVGIELGYFNGPAGDLPGAPQRDHVQRGPRPCRTSCSWARSSSAPAGRGSAAHHRHALRSAPRTEPRGGPGGALAAATGVVGASVVAMGMISLPGMRYGYSPALATGRSARGALGQIIPPSIVLIVLGNQLAVSAGKLFRGALLPGQCRWPLRRVRRLRGVAPPGDGAGAARLRARGLGPELGGRSSGSSSHPSP